MAISYGKLLCILCVCLTLATSTFGFCTDSIEFSCRNGKCYSHNAACDGYNDCGDNSDETGPKCASIIQKCGNTSFIYCHNSTKCLHRSRVCDGHNDCGDNYDERNCEGKVIRCYQCYSQSTCSNPVPRHKCSRGVTYCLAIKKRNSFAGFEITVAVSMCGDHHDCYNGSKFWIEEGYDTKCCYTDYCNHPLWTWRTTSAPGQPEESTSSTNAKCYVCNSETSFKDCDDRSVLRTCRTDHSTCFKVDYGISSTSNRQYAKGCVKSSECNKRSQSLCRTNGTDCNVYCCTGIGCNAGSGLGPSGATFWACALVYLFIRFM